MRKVCKLLLIGMIPLLIQTRSLAETPLTLAHTFPLPSAVKGHFDHFAIDLENHRLFTTPEGYKAVIVLDYQTGKVLHTIEGIGVPHAVLYRQDLSRIYVTDGEPGAVKIFDGKTYKLLKVVKLLAHTDSISYDSAAKDLYIITGGKQAKQEVSEIAVLNTTSEKVVGRIHLEGNALEAMGMETTGPRLYVNNTAKNSIDVIDREKRTLLASWPITQAQDNTSMALDETNHRLFVGCRSGSLVVFDTDTGKQLFMLPMTTGVDDMVFDPDTRRIYASCGGGEGFVEVYREEDPNHVEAIAKIPSGPAGKTSLLVTALHRYFVAVPQHDKTNAAILIYDVH
jgi:DNA-binding beta-propeller fold protein YncE